MAYGAAISWGTSSPPYYNFQSLILRFFAGKGLPPQSAARSIFVQQKYIPALCFCQVYLSLIRFIILSLTLYHYYT